MSTSQDVVLENGCRLPDVKTMQNAMKIGIVEDRPIMMDYWTESIEKKVIIGIRVEDGVTKKMLIKNKEEYTSYVDKVYRINQKDYIVLTENSIYIVDAAIESKKVSFEP